MIIENALKSKRFNIGLDYCIKALNINPDNNKHITNYFYMKINETDFKPKSYNDLLNIPEDYKYLPKMREILNELKTKYPKDSNRKYL